MYSRANVTNSEKRKKKRKKKERKKMTPEPPDRSGEETERSGQIDTQKFTHPKVKPLAREVER